MKKLLAFIFLFITIHCQAQVPNLTWGKKIWVRDNFQFKEYITNGISNDSTTNLKRFDYLITEEAAKRYTDRVASGLLKTAYAVDPIFVSTISDVTYLNFRQSLLDSIRNGLFGGGGGNYIPLSGTVAGSPVTGDIEILPVSNITGGLNSIKSVYLNDSSFIQFDVPEISLTSGGGANRTNLTLSPIGIFVNSDNLAAKGITGYKYYGANYDSLTYVQKKYVDSAIAAGGGGSSPWTTSGSDIYNSNAGNVGIGTSTPTVKLEVNGIIKTDRLVINKNPPEGTYYDISRFYSAYKYYDIGTTNSAGVIKLYSNNVTDAEEKVILDGSNNGSLNIPTGAVVAAGAVFGIATISNNLYIGQGFGQATQPYLIFQNRNFEDQNTKISIDNTEQGIVNLTLPNTSGKIALVSEIKTTFISVRKGEVDTLISTNSLVPGTTYNITDADVNLYGGTNIYLQAETTNKLAASGQGLFYNPRFDQTLAGNRVWYPYVEPTFSNIVGTFTAGETVTSNNAATAIYLANGFLKYVTGNWNAATSITGNASTATADITEGVNPVYNIGDSVVWGGKMWVNVNGDVGASVDKYTLDTEWSVVAFNTNDYNVVVDAISYDYANDLIIARKDKAGNDIQTCKATIDYFADNYGSSTSNSIKDFPWGGGYDFNTGKGVGKVISNNSYADLLNGCGRIYNIQQGQQSYISNITQSNSGNIFNITQSNNSNIFNITQTNSNLYYITQSGSALYNITQSGESNLYNITQNNGSSFNNITQSAESNISNIKMDNAAQIDLTTSGTLTGVIIQKITIDAAAFSADISAATDIYKACSKRIFSREDGTARLSYVNNSDVTVITDVNN